MMTYSLVNTYLTKNALAHAVRLGYKVRLYNPGLGRNPSDNGIEAVECRGWTALVEVRGGVVSKVL